jgi:hypothetical protein
MITCELMGGLGNQLFQIFATISYSMKYKKPFRFLYKDFLGSRNTYWNTFLFNLKTFTSLNMPKTTIIKEPAFNYNEIIDPPDSENVKLYGYYQSYKYFERSYKTICKLIKLEEQKEFIKKKYSHNYDNLVSMHFRLGDYKNLQDFHPVMKVEYYKQAIQYILNNSEKSLLKILYFCEKEDNEIVQNMIQQLQIIYPDCKFVKADESASDYEQILMMSLCKNNIIANSSFSWWAAYFNSREDKIVCYPDLWFGPKLKDINNTCDLFPETWIKIK